MVSMKRQRAVLGLVAVTVRSVTASDDKLLLSSILCCPAIVALKIARVRELCKEVSPTCFSGCCNFVARSRMDLGMGGEKKTNGQVK